MPPRMFHGNLLPPFVDLETVRSMSAIARPMAMMRKSIEGIQDAEGKIEAGGNFKDNMLDISVYAKLVVEDAEGVLSILRSVKMDVARYVREIRNAAS